MGQRSQIYVRINDRKGNKHLIAARYFSWNYGTRMVSRARYILEWLDGDYLERADNFIPEYQYANYPNEYRTKLKRIIETNFDYKDIVLSTDIIKEFKEDSENFSAENFTEWVFSNQDNNDGQFLLDCIITYPAERKYGDCKYKFKYAFLPYTEENPLDAIEYLNWDEKNDEDENLTWEDNPYISSGEKRYTKRNAKYISTHAQLMTPEEVHEYINYDYISSMELKR